LISISLVTIVACSTSDNSSAGPGTDGGNNKPIPTLDSGAPSNKDAGVDSGGRGDDSGGPGPGDDASSGSDSGNDTGADASTGPFTLTSSALTANADVPQAYTCATLSTQNAQGTGGDASPPLAWSGAPHGTASFALVLHDNDNNNTHWVLYDVPRTVTSLQQGIPRAAAPTVPVGAKQTKSYDGNYGYMGPCPNAPHTYTFTIYAMPTATTPGIKAGDRAGAETIIKGAALGSSEIVVTSSDSQG
jgi:Raf kinase inhibitor-like YbhB/YbcL family protein